MAVGAQLRLSACVCHQKKSSFKLPVRTWLWKASWVRKLGQQNKKGQIERLIFLWI